MGRAYPRPDGGCRTGREVSPRVDQAVPSPGSSRECHGALSTNENVAHPMPANHRRRPSFAGPSKTQCRVGRTARAGRSGWSLSFVTQYDVDLVRAIEGLLGRQLAAWEAPEKEALAGITKVYAARRMAVLRLAEEEDAAREMGQRRKKVRPAEGEAKPAEGEAKRPRKARVGGERTPKTAPIEQEEV